jgi:tetratricopeptide (TPR) repeat protein
VTPERYRQVCEAFDRVMEAPAAERGARLAAACPDAALRADVERLLADAEAARQSGFLASPFAAAPLPAAEAAEDWVGRRIGPYEIRAVLGEGGMGRVFRAERVGGFRQQVAVKVVHPGRRTAQVLRRFRNERQVLASLQHPHIAQLLDGGATDDGLPYFVMEYVEGIPIDAYCRETGASVRRQLELFLAVCSGVLHAHQKGVIHRDLKPSNILVESPGRVKIVDFGVARVSDADLRATAAHTEVGQLVGTLAYMSPEQIAGDPGEIDTRSDVYALGVVCFELLTGRLPFDVRGQPLPEAVRLMTETEPRRLGDGDRRLRGDLDTIAAKALQNDKARRYATASELAADVERFLRDEPIMARPPGALYRAGKFVRRHKALTAASAVALLALALGVAGLSAGLLQARKQAAAAARAGAQAADSARRSRDAVRDLVQIAGTGALRSDPQETATRKQLLQAALRRYEEMPSEEQAEPGLRLAMANASLIVAQIDRAAGLRAEARAAAGRAVEWLEAQVHQSPDSPDCLNKLGFAYDEFAFVQDDPAKELELLQRGLEVRQRLVKIDAGRGPSALAASLSNLAAAYAEMGRNDQAVKQFEKAVAAWQPLVEASPPQTWPRYALSITMQDLARAAGAAGRPDDALRSARRAVDLAGELLRIDPKYPDAGPNLAHAWNCLRDACDRTGRPAEATEASAKACAALEAVVKQHPRVDRWREQLSADYLDLTARYVSEGRPADVAAVVRKWGQLRPDNGDDLYNRACRLAQCVPLVGSNKDGLTDAGRAQRRAYGDQAMELLRQATAAGFTDVAQLDADGDLESLRGRPDFGRLREVWISRGANKPRAATDGGSGP